MPIVSPAGDPSDDKHLWWRCVFIAAGIQPILILLYFMFRSTSLGIILLILYFPCIVFAIQLMIPVSFVLLPVCVALHSFILGSIIYFVCWLKEKDY